MTEFFIKLLCPQDNNPCEGREKCAKDRAKGCAQDTFDTMKIEQEDRNACL